MKLYTKGGDGGETDLRGGRRVPKDDIRIAAYGDLDELNATIGMAVAALDDDTTIGSLRDVQNRLFDLGAALMADAAKDDDPVVSSDDVTTLESWIDAASAELSELKNFILPGGTEAAARLHLARTVCRRAERTLVSLGGMTAIPGHAIQYVNRLSDLLFALARLANARASVADVPWQHTKP
ncbi:MAG: cob(I)yrinic acid a,c-diamide adenosyltransferase [Planctomycetes bacterium]|nr:cob(I)yrinic acid a,c-diamide adenosyltransferase [Planctomycetota bacterium]